MLAARPRWTSNLPSQDREGRLFISRGLLPQAREDVQGNFVGGGVVADDGQRQAKDKPVVANIQFAQGLGSVLGHPLKQGHIVQF